MRPTPKNIAKLAKSGHTVMVSGDEFEMITSRVTRLCEFTPIWRLFSVCSFFNARRAQNFFGYFFPQ
jgi:hypothetical protein